VYGRKLFEKILVSKEDEVSKQFGTLLNKKLWFLQGTPITKSRRQMDWTYDKDGGVQEYGISV
jgi:hypothetical protein